MRSFLQKNMTLYTKIFEWPIENDESDPIVNEPNTSKHMSDTNELAGP